MREAERNGLVYWWRMGLLDIFFGNVEMPRRVSFDLIRGGILKVRAAIEAEERARLERERREEEARNRGEGRDDDEEDPTIRCAAYSFKERLCFAPTEKRPPNLKAAVLSFSARLLTYVREKCGGRGVVAYKRAGVGRNVYSRIISDDGSMVGKRTALQFCIGLQLSRPEADLLLKAAGYALSETIPEDCAFAYCIEHSIWNLADVNCILSQCGIKTIETQCE